MVIQKQHKNIKSKVQKTKDNNSEILNYQSIKPYEKKLRDKSVLKTGKSKKVASKSIAKTPKKTKSVAVKK